MAIEDWDLDPTNNTSVTDATYGNINWAENQDSNTVNNSARSMMAHTRRFFETLEWRDFGHTPTRTGNTTFTVTDDQTAVYTKGRRIRCTDSSTLYGTITSSTYTTSTEVVVNLDSGSLSASLTAVAVGPDPTNRPSGPHYFTENSSFTQGLEHVNSMIGVDTSSGDATATLTAAATCGNGFLVGFYVTDATNTLTIDANGSETINGATTITLNRVGDYVWLLCDGANWNIAHEGRSLRGCYVYRTASQSITTGNPTDVTFPTASSTELYDTDSAHDGSTNTARITIPSGVYVANVTAALEFEANSTGTRRIEIYKNNAQMTPTIRAQAEPVSEASSLTIMQVTTGVIEVTPGDYFEVLAFQSSGGNLNVTSAFLHVEFK